MQERRLSARYRCRCPAAVQGPNSEYRDMEIREVSLTGLTLWVRREVVLALAQAGSILTLGDRIHVSSRGAGVEDGAPEVALPCRVQHVRRLSQDRYQVGTRFEVLDPRQLEVLEQWVARAQGGHGSR
ncbi:MAG: PilZ domain-containing protein [Gammaproteobacteria bacterium]|nr:PilZ domain-containing protein [Gammaproteobacteria bacterium]